MMYHHKPDSAFTWTPACPAVQVLDMPKRLTAYSGLDTLTHALERWGCQSRGNVCCRLRALLGTRQAACSCLVRAARRLPCWPDSCQSGIPAASTESAINCSCCLPHRHLLQLRVHLCHLLHAWPLQGGSCPHPQAPAPRLQGTYCLAYNALWRARWRQRQQSFVCWA